MYIYIYTVQTKRASCSNEERQGGGQRPGADRPCGRAPPGCWGPEALLLISIM